MAVEDLFREKHILVGITGSIAAYKGAEVVSRLVQLGARVRVIMTPAAQKFVSPLTFQTLTGNSVLTDMFSGDYGRVAHVSLASEVDLVIIAPATAQTIARLANGLADELLSATVLAAKAPVLVAPAMNRNMYTHPAVRENLQKLTSLGYHVIAPEEGWLACGEVGPGRLPAPEIIVEQAARLLWSRRDFEGVTALVTAGPTREPIDPVRFISNRSSGKMGYAIARALSWRGAQVILVSGPTALDAPLGVQAIRVETAAQMHEQVLNHFPEVDLVIKAAAVADFRPEKVFSEKIKQKEGLVIELKRNPDILAELGKRKRGQILVGFAAETHDLLENAQEKMRAKNLDLIIANDVTAEGAGFEADTNIITIIRRSGEIIQLPKLTKFEAAHHILDEVNRVRKERTRIER